jgi:hypothetical protein
VLLFEGKWLIIINCLVSWSLEHGAWRGEVHPVIVEMTRYVSSITKGILGLLFLLLEALSFSLSISFFHLYHFFTFTQATRFHNV